MNFFAVRPSVGQALANDTLGEFSGAIFVVNAQGDAVVMAEVKFREIAMRKQAIIARCFTQAVHKKPRRFVADAEYTVDLMRAGFLSWKRS